MPPTTVHQPDRTVTYNKLLCYFKAIYSFSTSCFLSTFLPPIPSSTGASNSNGNVNSNSNGNGVGDGHKDDHSDGNGDGDGNSNSNGDS